MKERDSFGCSIFFKLNISSEVGPNSLLSLLLFELVWGADSWPRLPIQRDLSSEPKNPSRGFPFEGLDNKTDRLR
jgi:hypothetical protein